MFSTGVETTEALMGRYAAGDTGAFAELYRRTSPSLRRYLRRLTNEAPRAEDLLQLTFAKIHCARDRYIQGMAVLPWAKCIARHCFFDERRNARTRKEDLSFDGDLPEPVFSAEPSGELIAAVRLAVENLKLNHRQAIESTRFLGLSHEEAAQSLHTTPTAIKLRVHRGYGHLRGELSRYARSA